MNFRVQDGFAALIDRPIELHDPVRESGDDFAHSAADMRADGQTIDLRHMLIDPHVAIIDIHKAQTDRRISVDLLDFVENGFALGDGGPQFAIDGGLFKSQPYGLARSTRLR